MTAPATDARDDALPPDDRAVVEAITRALEAVRTDPEVAAEAGRVARDAAPATEPVMPLHEVRRHVDALLAALVAALRGDTDRARAGAAADALAVDRAAQGVSLRAVLDGFHAARQVVFREILRHVQDTVPAHRLIPLLLVVDAEIGSLEKSMVLAHQAAEQRIGRAGDGTQVQALRRLFTDGDPAAATELGLDRERTYRCVVLDVSAPAQVRPVDARLAAATGSSGLVAGYLTAVTSGWPSADTFTDVLVVCSPLVTIDDLPRAHVVCREALDVARAHGHVGVRAVTDYLIELAVSAQPDLGRLLAHDLLPTLDPIDGFHRELAETALAYLSHGARLQATAAALHVHPNTVAYRLRRLGELTGFTAAGDGDGAFEHTARWWWALRAWLSDAR